MTLAPSQPHSRRVMAEHACELESLDVWGELQGTFVKKSWVQRKHRPVGTPYVRKLYYT